MSENISHPKTDKPATDSPVLPAPEEFSVEGILVLDAKGGGSLRSPRRRGKAFPSDPFVPKEIVKRFKMKTGSWIVAKAQQKKGQTNEGNQDNRGHRKRNGH